VVVAFGLITLQMARHGSIVVSDGQTPPMRPHPCAKARMNGAPRWFVDGRNTTPPIAIEPR
jgi:hypothetical protein